MGIPQHWRVRKQRYALVGEACNQCGTKHFPPRGACPVCSRPSYELPGFEGNGGVYPSPLVISLPLTTGYSGPAAWRWSERRLEPAALPQSLPATQAS